MARDRDDDYSQGKFIPVHFDTQILPGTFEYTLHDLIDNEIDLSVFEARYQNDETGAPADNPAILLKIIVSASSRGITSSRKIAQCCRENIAFMARAADQPHCTTLAECSASLDEEATRRFLEGLLLCDELGVIGKERLAVDGCKRPSNASKAWSGTKADLGQKHEKMEQALRQIRKRHRELDITECNQADVAQERQAVDTLRKKVRKITQWLTDHEDQPGKSGNPLKSNLTDNDSAKMQPSQGVIPGYDGVAVVDDKRQVVVHAEAVGTPQEHDLLQPMIEGVRENFAAIGVKGDCVTTAKRTAASGFHTEADVRRLMEQGSDGYVADTQFRKRDPRVADVDRYKERFRQDRAADYGTRTRYRPKDFTMSEEKTPCIGPAGRRRYRHGGNVIRGHPAVTCRGRKTDCRGCDVRAQCLRHPERSEVRQVHFFSGPSANTPETSTQKMKRKLDSVRGRLLYNRRLETAEPGFANIRSTLGLDRFTRRGRRKVNTQWVLYCLVHNLLQVHRYGPGFA